MSQFQILIGDCLELLRQMPDNSVDSVVTDPPYGLSFMGKKWDCEVPSVDVWVECLRVLKPGGHLLAFAGTRTQHRMAVRIEDAGFEIRDMIAWVYGSGFPKSLNVAKAIDSGSGRPEDIRRMQLGEAYIASGRGRKNYDHGAASAMDGGAKQWEPTSEAAKQWAGWGTALKPALEPITVARKPLMGTVAANVLMHGTGAINIDGCRVGSETTARVQHGTTKAWEGGSFSGEFATGSESGRWPANLIHDGSDEVIKAFPDAPGQLAAASTSDTQRAGQNCYGTMKRGRAAEASADSENGGIVGFQMKPGDRRLDTGSAARFFYCAKTSRTDRHEGMSNPGPQFKMGTTLRKVETTETKGNNHPTVKPTDLMAYLLRLVTPPGGVALDPFMGSGSTGKAAMREGFEFIGCEIDEQYAAIARARIEYEVLRQQEQKVESDQLDLFATA